MAWKIMMPRLKMSEDRKSKNSLQDWMTTYSAKSASNPPVASWDIKSLISESADDTWSKSSTTAS